MKTPETHITTVISVRSLQELNKETLQFIETLQTAWEQLGLDIFTSRNTQYLLVIDYFSQFPVVKQLQSLHSLSVIKQLKDIFTEIGIPRCMVSDGGTQFTSQEFQDFTKTWGIQHKVTSPTNVQSNGQAERFVQTIKKQSHKSHRRGRGSAPSNPCICHNTFEPQSTITHRVTQL